MKEVFLDTVGLIAIWDDTDQWHTVAEVVFGQLLASQRSLVTTPLVLLECANAAARRTYRSEVSELRKALLAENCVIEPTSQEIEEAWATYRAGRRGSPGIVDLVSFAVMRRLGISEAFTNDQHFTAAGFTTVF